MKPILLASRALVCAVACFSPPGNASGQNVEITDAGFAPATITVNQGSEVFWFNDGSEVHSTRANSGEWNSGRLEPLDFYSTFLTHTGAFPYSCSQHTGKTGSVTVIVAVIPPMVSVFYPAADTRFGQPATLSFQVLASDSDGSVSNVIFIADGATLGTDVVSPFNLLLTNLAAGNHVLSALATDNQGFTGTSAPVNITVTAPVGGATWFVDVVGGKFSPANLSITAGDTVIFRNLDASNHTATGTFTSREALCGSTQLTATRACTNTFNVPGSYEYFCGLHPNERGTVTVSQAMSAPLRLVSPMVNASGRFQFDLTTTPGLTYVIQRTTSFPPLWNPVQTNLAATNLLRFVETQPVTPGERRFYHATVQP